MTMISFFIRSIVSWICLHARHPWYDSDCHRDVKTELYIIVLSYIHWKNNQVHFNVVYRTYTFIGSLVLLLLHVTKTSVFVGAHSGKQYLLYSTIIITSLFQGSPQYIEQQRKTQKRSISWIFRGKTIAYINLAVDFITHKFLFQKLIPICLKSWQTLKYS